jgi:sugar lactone lactonase YvrE
MTMLTKAAATAAAGLTLVCLTTASAQPTPAARAAGTPSATLVAQLPADNTALDASPDPSGRVIYFTTSGKGGPGIYRVPAAGGARHAVLVGGRLRAPAGLAVSNDGKRLYVADRKAGHILVVAARGGAAHVLRGSAGSSPRGLEIQTRGGRDFVVFTGRSHGQPALLRLRTTGAARPTVLRRGAPLRAPDGVAISKTGAIYVTDHSGASGGRALRIDGTAVTTVADHILLGHPGGIALTLDESKLLISSLRRGAGTAQVLIVDTASGATSTFDDVISANHAAGGLHRARAAVPFGWADVSRSGHVYRVDP